MLELEEEWKMQKGSENTTGKTSKKACEQGQHDVVPGRPWKQAENSKKLDMSATKMPEKRGDPETNDLASQPYDAIQISHPQPLFPEVSSGRPSFPCRPRAGVVSHGTVLGDAHRKVWHGSPALSQCFGITGIDPAEFHRSFRPPG